MSVNDAFMCHARVASIKLDSLVRSALREQYNYKRERRGLYACKNHVMNGLPEISLIAKHWFDHVARSFEHTDHLTSKELLFDNIWKMFCQRMSIDPGIIHSTDNVHGNRMIDIFVSCIKDAVYLRIPMHVFTVHDTANTTRPAYDNNLFDAYSTTSKPKSPDTMSAFYSEWMDEPDEPREAVTDDKPRVVMEFNIPQ